MGDRGLLDEVCRRRRAIVEATFPGEEERETAQRGTMLQKHDYLVGRSSPDAFHRLLRLRSDFWSFVEIGKGGNR